MYYAMAYPHAEPVIAAPIGRVPPGMYKNAEKPGRSIRTHHHNGQTWGIAAGTTFKPGHPDEEQMARLSRLPGLVAHPSVGRAELAAVVHAADAGLLPHVRNDLTEAMSPLKLYEYLAAGLPVAAVDLPPLHGVSERVVIGEDFAASVERALALGRAGEDERRAFVERHSWEAKHEAILDLALRADPAG